LIEINTNPTNKFQKTTSYTVNRKNSYSRKQKNGNRSVVTLHHQILNGPIKALKEDTLATSFIYWSKFSRL